MGIDHGHGVHAASSSSSKTFLVSLRPSRRSFEHVTKALGRFQFPRLANLTGTCIRPLVSIFTIGIQFHPLNRGTEL